MTPGRFVCSLLFSVGMMLSTIVFGLAVLLLIAVPLRWRIRFVRLYAIFNLWSLEKLCGIKYRIEGREHIPSGTAIVFCKHQSTWETLLLQKVFPPLVWVLKRELMWLPFFGWGLALLRPIAIDRGAGRKAVEQVVQQGTARLRSGLWVVIFPEGTRVAPGTKGRYRAGGAMLAEHSGYPVVPVAHNAGEFWPRHGFLKRPGTVRVVIGPPIESAGRGAEAILADAEAWIEGTMHRISGVPYQN